MDKNKVIRTQRPGRSGVGEFLMDFINKPLLFTASHIANKNCVITAIQRLRITSDEYPLLQPIRAQESA